MNNKLKIKAGAIAAVMGLGTGHSNMALANGGPSIGYAQSCGLSIVMPDNGDDYYMSEDCKNVYFVPKKGGNLELLFADYTVTPNFCENLDSVEDSILSSEAQRKKIEKQRDFYLPGSAKFDALTGMLEREMAILKRAKEEKKELLQTSDGRYRAGVYLRVHLEETDSDKIVDSAISKNRAYHKQGINFLMAPVAESFISITNSEKYKKDMYVPEVVATYLPLIKRESNDDKTHTYLFNGSASGEIYLSAEKGCQMQKDFGTNLNLASPQQLENYLVANQTYTVPLRTSFGYTAKIKFEHALNDYLKFVQTKSKFSITEYKNHLNTSGTAENFEVFINNNEMSQEVRERLEKMGYFDDLLTNIKADLNERFLEIIKTHNLLQVENSQLSAPEAGVEQQAQVGYQCHTKKSWGGFKKKSNCGNYIYYVPVNVNGYADQVRDIVNKVDVNIDYGVRINETIYRYHTSSMISPLKDSGE